MEDLAHGGSRTIKEKNELSSGFVNQQVHLSAYWFGTCVDCIAVIGGDSLLHVSVCCKSLASQALLKWSKDVQISGPLLVAALFAISRHAVSHMMHTTHHLVLNSVMPLLKLAAL